MRHDPAGLFRLTAAQSRAGQALYRRFGLDPDALDTVLLVENGAAFVRSDAALRIAARLGWPWAAASVLRCLPRRIRDLVYDAVARNRYRIFGRRPACFVPRPDQADRFV